MGSSKRMRETPPNSPEGRLLVTLVVLGALIGCSSSGVANVDPASSTDAPPTSSVAPPAASFDPYDGATLGSAAIGTVSDELIDTPDGRQRHFRVYLPSQLPEGRPVPLLLALHGGLGSSDQFAVNSGFDELAESNGFIVVYPDGIRAVPDRPGFQTWNGGYCCGPAARQNVDDVGYVRFLIVLLSKRYPIDSSRVFAAGHSNGAIMAYRLACEMSDLVVAIGVQAGSSGTEDCRPALPVSVLHIHGLSDTNHPIDGGRGTGVSGVEFRSGRDAVRTMATLDGCSSDPDFATLRPNPDVEISTWSDCDSGVEVRLITVEGATHAWMGHPGISSGSSALVGEPYLEFDSSRAIWSFLADHSRP